VAELAESLVGSLPGLLSSAIGAASSLFGAVGAQSLRELVLYGRRLKVLYDYTSRSIRVFHSLGLSARPR
jgi:hypothetical protein